MKALVTGGAGFIGHHLVRTLLDRGDEVVVIDNFSTGHAGRLDSRAVFVEGDIRDRVLVTRLFAEAKFDVVFHTAALARIQPSIKDPVTTHDVNVTGTLNVLRAAAESGVRRVVYSSSSSIYGNQESLPFHEGMIPNPQNPYAMQKWMGEELCRLFSNVYGLDTACLRYFNVYGPGMIAEGAYCTVLSIFLRQADRRERLTIIGDGGRRRDFTHVRDIVAGNLAAADAAGRFDGDAFNLGFSSNVSVREVAERILAAHGLSWEEGTVMLPDRPGEALATLADRSKAGRALRWEPRVGFDEGLAELLETSRVLSSS
jgi:UDP-glucose 4-epimerase